MLGYFLCIFSSEDVFNISFKIIFQKYHQSVETFGSGSVKQRVAPDLGPNSFLRLSAYDKKCY